MNDDSYTEGLVEILKYNAVDLDEAGMRELLPKPTGYRHADCGLAVAVVIEHPSVPMLS